MASRRKVRERFPVAPPQISGSKYRQWLESQVMLYEQTLDGIADAVMVAMPDGKVTYVNTACINMLGMPIESLLHTKLCGYFVDDRGLPQSKSILSLLRSSGTLRHHRVHLRCAGNCLLPIELNVTRLMIDNAVVRIIATCRDMRWELEQRQRLEVQALTDRLTGCKNRWWFDVHYAKCISETESHATQMGLIFIDLDNFKKVNDQSFIFGDELIRKAAAAIRSVLRPGDALVRLGGDEFVLSVSNVSLAPIMEIANRILSALRELVIYMPKNPQERFSLTASIGVSVLHGCDSRLIDLLDYAQEAKRLAKINGKNRIFVLPENIAVSH